METICFLFLSGYPAFVKRTYREISFPPLTEEQKKELEALENMKEEDIDTDDIPEADFSDAEFYYSEIRPKKR